MRITPTNLREIVATFPETENDMVAEPTVALNSIDFGATRFTTELYLGNPGDTGYINKPVPAVLINCFRNKDNGTVLWFIHQNHSNCCATLTLSRVSVSDHETGIRTTASRRIIVREEDRVLGAIKIPLSSFRALFATYLTAICTEE